MTVSPIAKCEYILRQFAKYSVQELADSAHSLIMPVVLGLAKPTMFKLSVQNGSNASASSFGSGGSGGGSSSDYLAIGGGCGGNQYALAEEVFNLESPLHRQLTSSISTTLITPAPVVKKATVAEVKNSNFKNTFESVAAVVKTEKKVEFSSARTSGSSSIAMPPPTLGSG